MILICLNMLNLTLCLNFNRVKWCRHLRFFLNTYRTYKNFFISNRQTCNMSYFFNSFSMLQNSNIRLKKHFNLYYDKNNLIGFYLVKGLSKFSNIFYILSVMHKIFLKKGFMLKIIKAVNSSLQKLSVYFFNSCFSLYILDSSLLTGINPDSNNGTTDTEVYANSTALEVYSFKYFNNTFRDIFNITNSDNIGIGSYSIIYDNAFNDITGNANMEYSDFLTSTEVDNENTTDGNKSVFFLNIFFKYFFFCNMSNFFNFFKFNGDCSISTSSDGYLLNLYNKSFKSMPVSFYNKYFSLLFLNIKHIYFEDYLKLLNNFFSILYFIPKLINKIYFFFKIQLMSLSKRIKKILKNKRKFRASYTYIKPKKRLHTTVYYLKKYLLLTDGKDLQDKIFNVFYTTLSGSKSS